jgi:hypothetical protein
MDIAAKNSISDIGCVHESLGKSIDMQLIGTQPTARERREENK